MSDRVVEQIALGVSTRGYERSLEPVDESIETRGASKSNASRALIDATTEKLAQFVSRKLDDVDLVAMFIDGIELCPKLDRDGFTRRFARRRRGRHRAFGVGRCGRRAGPNRGRGRG